MSRNNYTAETLAGKTPEELSAILDAHEAAVSIRQHVGGANAGTLAPGPSELTPEEHAAVVAVSMVRGVEQARLEHEQAVALSRNLVDLQAAMALYDEADMERRIDREAARFQAEREARQERVERIANGQRLEPLRPDIRTDVNHSNLDSWLASPIGDE